MKITGKTVIGIVAAAVVVALATLLLPAPTNVGPIDEFRWSVVVSVLYGSFYVSAAALFLIGVRGFKTQVRRAYLLLVIGMLLATMTFTIVPIITILNLWGNPIFAAGLDGIPYMLAGLFVYAGMRKFARLIDIHGLATSFICTVAIALAVAVLAAFIPSSVPGDQTPIRSFDAIIGWIGTLSTLAAIVTWTVCTRIGALYTKAMTVLFLAQACTVLSLVVNLIYSLIATFHATWFANAVIDPALVLSSFLYLLAGYFFTKTREY